MSLEAAVLLSSGYDVLRMSRAGDGHGLRVTRRRPSEVLRATDHVLRTTFHVRRSTNTVSVHGIGLHGDVFLAFYVLRATFGVIRTTYDVRRATHDNSSDSTLRAHDHSATDHVRRATYYALRTTYRHGERRTHLTTTSLQRHVRRVTAAPPAMDGTGARNMGRL